jgi:hypothetical protein
MWKSFLRTLGVSCVCTMASFAQSSVTVREVIAFVQSSITSKLPDKEVAIEVAKLRLKEKLEDQTIEDLQTAGAGPRTVAALTHLADESAKLPPPPPPPPPPTVPDGGPPPSEAKQREIIEAVREYALNYASNLPNFICVQRTRRAINRNYKPGDQAWTPQDNFAEKLSVVEHKENYELIGGKPGQQLGGALSRGDWSSLMQAVFDPSSEAYFGWSRWTGLRVGSGPVKKFYVFRYVIDQAHSRESLDADGKKCTPGFHGEVYVPMDANVVWRMTVEPDPPTDFPMQDIKETLKYDFVTISGQQFILPTSSEVVMRTGRIGNHNEISFTLYQKYSADAVIKFDDTDDPPPATTTPPPTTPPADNNKKKPQP